MKIIDCVWEKRNLGCNVVEITLDKDDENKTAGELQIEINNAIEQYDAGYSVIKFDSKNNIFLSLMKDLGYSFIEIQIIFEANLKNYCNKEEIASVNYKFSTSENDYLIVYDSIQKGMFYTDRISLDEKFGIDVANIRYVNWIKDLKDRENYKLIMIYTNNNFLGFHFGRMEYNRFDVVLDGIVKEYQHNKLGKIWGNSLLKSIYGLSQKAVIPVSSNNIGAVKVWESLGCKIDKLIYVYTKHNDSIVV